MVPNTLTHMSAGCEKTSYANNSGVQRTMLSKRRQSMEDTLKKAYNDGFSKCLKIADFGCAAGPNVFYLLSQIIETIYALSQENNSIAPDIQIYLNDLPKNDFNSIFKLAPSYIKELSEKFGNKFQKCFIAGVPGSFYGRLFPDKSLYFVNSCSSLHWLSQVPAELKNKGNVYIARTSHPEVFETYLNQFQKDFNVFLSSRAEEVLSGGRMILTFLGRNFADPRSENCYDIWELFSDTLRGMVAEGLVREKDVDSFNLPYYAPYKDEVMAIIQEEGSFNLEILDTFECGWDEEPSDENGNFVLESHHARGRKVANSIRGFSEPLLINHFGETILDDLFGKFAERIANHLVLKNTKYFNITISMSRK